MCNFCRKSAAAISLKSGLLALALAATPAAAQLGERDQPIHLEADRAELDQAAGVSVYRGNVVIAQGGLEIRADQVTVHTEDGAVQHLVADGEPARFRRDAGNGRKAVRGHGQRLEYRLGEWGLAVSGAAEIVQGGDVVRGGRILYDIASDRVRARPAPGQAGERVRIILSPRGSEQ